MKTTKTQAIRNALENGDRPTHMKALAYGTHRLAAVIHRLRKQGMDITATVKEDANGARFTEYALTPQRFAESYNLAA